MSSAIAVVVIGRNEGERLTRCLSSITPRCDAIVYVDSGSSDGSPVAARELGVDVIELDWNRPFTAARGRNAGFEWLRKRDPQLALVQFIDGDCELRTSWLDAAHAYLDAHPAVAAVAGRRRERHPEASVYNQLADIEWDTEIGDAGGFGGDVLIRASVFREVGGYDESLIAGEDPDLCFRIRRAGHGVARLAEEMTLHDADMHRFSEFWRRQVRGGHAYAELVALHGRKQDPDSFRSLASIVFWAGLLPLLVALFAFTAPLLAVAALLLYVRLWVRIRRRQSLAERSPRAAALYATACVIGKFAELRGALLFAWTRFVLRRDSRLIEYKGPDEQAEPSRREIG